MVDQKKKQSSSKGGNGENKHDAFVRLGEWRINTLLKRLALLGNLSNRAAYEYSDAELDQMLAAIDDGVAKMKARFAAKEEQVKFHF